MTNQPEEEIWSSCKCGAEREGTPQDNEQAICPDCERTGCYVLVDDQPQKPNCYECKYRGTLAGNAHSSCKHPEAEKARSNLKQKMPLAGLLFKITGGLPPLKSGLNIKGHPTGIRGGWFSWPSNFDPVWLQECDGFTPKGVPNA